MMSTAGFLEVEEAVWHTPIWGMSDNVPVALFSAIQAYNARQVNEEFQRVDLYDRQR